jgi:hypothetical protein
LQASSPEFKTPVPPKNPTKPKTNSKKTKNKQANPPKPKYEGA